MWIGATIIVSLVFVIAFLIYAFFSKIDELEDPFVWTAVLFFIMYVAAAFAVSRLHLPVPGPARIESLVHTSYIRVSPTK